MVAAPELVIIGAGPAGLACGYEATRLGLRPLLLEAEERLGGIARTERLGDCLYDLGGHRFYTQEPEVRELWDELMGDDWLRRPRLSRIFYRDRFFDYPLRLGSTLRKLGAAESLAIVGSYLASHLRPHCPPRNFEQWVVNHFGRRLFEHFFRSYTEKVWGTPCDEMSPDWAGARIRGMSLGEVLRAMLAPRSGAHGSLYDHFLYPPLGPSEMWDRMWARVEQQGGTLRASCPVTRLRHHSGRVVALTAGAEELEVAPGAVVSSMPLGQLLLALDPPPPSEVLEAARSLTYRAMVIVALRLQTEDSFPDNWLYIHAPEVAVGRLQNEANWSPALVPEPGVTCLALEYFCWEGDDRWRQPDEELRELACAELDRLGLLRGAPVLGHAVTRIPRAYPLYGREQESVMRTLREYLAGFRNLQVIGRNGMHCYNNMSHSMVTGRLAARNVAGESHDLWQVHIGS